MRRSVKRRVWNRVGVVAAVAVAAIGLSLAPAGAVTNTTIGHAQAGSTCGSELTIVQPQSSLASYTVPAGGGLVSSWSGDSGAGTGSTLQMLLWRPAGGLVYTLVGESPVKVLAANSGINTFTLVTPIAAQAGDVLGLHATGSSYCGPIPGGSSALVRVGAPPALGANLDFSAGYGVAGSANVAATVTTGQCGPGLTAHYIGVTTSGIYGSAVFCLNAMGIGTLSIPGAGTAPAQIIKAGNVVWFSANGNNLRVSGYLNTSTGASSFVETRPFGVSGKVLTLT